jgi:DIS3-like exonuclease 2
MEANNSNTSNPTTPVNNNRGGGSGRKSRPVRQRSNTDEDQKAKNKDSTPSGSEKKNRKETERSPFTGGRGGRGRGGLGFTPPRDAPKRNSRPQTPDQASSYPQQSYNNMPFNYNDENKKLSRPPRFSPLPGSFLEVNTPPKRERNDDDSNTNTPSYRKKGVGASPKPAASPLKSSADVPSEQKKKRRKRKAANSEQTTDEATPQKEGAEASGEKKRKRRPRKKKNAENGASDGQPKTPAKEKTAKSAANTPAGQKGKRSSPVYEEYWTEEQVEQAVKEGKAHLAELRVNPYNRSEGYSTVRGFGNDVMIEGRSQNRAFDGDVVVLVVAAKDEWVPLKVKEEDEEEAKAEIRHAEEEEEPVDIDLDALKVGSPEKDVESLQERMARVDLSDESTTESDEESDESEEGEEDESSDDAVPANNTAAPISSDTPSTDKPVDTPAVVNTPVKSAPISVPTTPATPSRTPSKAAPIMRPIGRVVAIKEARHKTRTFVGFLRPNSPKGGVRESDKAVQFVPLDKKHPKFLILRRDVPQEFLQKCDELKEILYAVKFWKWAIDMRMPLARDVKKIGLAGSIIAETQALITEYEVDDSDFHPRLVEGIPDKLEISPEEQALRRDFRDIRVFTIDPKTARDLDDALSCVKLDNGNFKVGVHIADVSHYIKPGSELDTVARGRSTSVYLVQECIPMLPRQLSENLCSLNPRLDRFAFSVEWELTPKGDIVSQWIGKSMIRTCCRLAYEDAQLVIDSGTIEDPKQRNLKSLEALYNLSLKNPAVEPHLIAQDILNLHSIAVNLREKRFASGALKLDSVRLSFTLDEDGNPTDYYQYIQRESNRLVEEFMLLANMSVAEFIYKVFPKAALLRRHPPPNERKMNDYVKFLSSLGIQLAGTSSAELHRYLETCHLRYPDIKNIRRILEELTTRPMQVAQYFCSAEIDDLQIKDYGHHYALNVPYYTHFTSPIRRYPDLIVHRTLQAALLATEQKPIPDGFVVPSESLKEWAVYCNNKKMNAKRAQEKSSHVYLCAYMKDHPLEEEAVVIELSRKVFAVFSMTIGERCRIFTEDLKCSRVDWQSDSKTLKLTWPSRSLAVNYFHTVPVRFTATNTHPADIKAQLLLDPSN